jgi:hypothetical protein
LRLTSTADQDGRDAILTYIKDFTFGASETGMETLAGIPPVKSFLPTGSVDFGTSFAVYWTQRQEER